MLISSLARVVCLLYACTEMHKKQTEILRKNKKLGSIIDDLTAEVTIRAIYFMAVLLTCIE